MAPKEAFLAGEELDRIYMQRIIFPAFSSVLPGSS